MGDNVKTTLWIDAQVLRNLEAEATHRTPTETGGILLGYWLVSGQEAVVTDWIGPGERAHHARTWFIPDQKYHEAEIARRYATSGRMLCYLGDWHTHPNGPPQLSARDLRTLTRIATSAEAASPTPIMLVLTGGRPWSPSAWIAHAPPPSKFRFPWHREIRTNDARVKTFRARAS